MQPRVVSPAWLAIAATIVACAAETTGPSFTSGSGTSAGGNAAATGSGAISGSGANDATGAVASGVGGTDSGMGGGTTGTGATNGTGGAGASGMGGGSTGSGGTDASGGTAGTSGTDGAGGTDGTGGTGAAGGAGAGGSGGAGGTTTGAGGTTTGAGGTTTGAGGTTTGTGGTTGGAGGTGGGGAGGSGGTGTESCSGCARLSVPLTAANQRTPFIIYLTDPGMGLDMSSTTLTARVSVFSGTNGAVQLFAQNGEAQNYAQTRAFHPFNTLTGFTEISLDIGTQAGDADFVPTEVEAIGIEVHAGGTGPWTNPTVVDLDRMALSNGASLGAGPWEFTSSVSPLIINDAADPVPGSTLTFLGP